jgi:hypothetical protein
MGVNKGKKIALMMKNSDHFVLPFFVCILIGEPKTLGCRFYESALSFVLLGGNLYHPS